MTPFLEFRTWLRRGPAAERVIGAIAAVVILALAVWALVPVDNDDGVGIAAGGSAAAGRRAGGAAAPGTGGDEIADPLAAEAIVGGEAAAGTDGAGATTSASGGNASAGVGTPGGPNAATASCDGLRATDQGVTDKEVLVAVPIIALAGDVGNEAFGIRGDLEAVARAAEAGINADGGVACRRFRIKTYRVNPLDQNDTRAKCLQIVGDKVFAVIDFGSYLSSVTRACFTQHKLPYQGSLAITEEEASKSFPWMYTVSASADRQLRSWVFEAAARGTFDRSKGFRKLGLALNNCEPKINDELKRNLREVGVGNDQLSVFTMSCGAVNPPNEISQAMTQHNRDGASHVMFGISQANAQRYVQFADQVNFRPTYQASDYGAVTVTTSEDGFTNGFNGTVGITSQRGGEINSGMKHALVAPCQEWYRRANVPPPQADGDPAFSFCTFFRLFQAVANAAGPDLTRTALIAEGLPKVGNFESVTHGDTVFDRRGKVTGGDTVRAISWRLDCRCWRVVDPAFKPAR